MSWLGGLLGVKETDDSVGVLITRLEEAQLLEERKKIVQQLKELGSDQNKAN
jgi:hypothetical protein